MPRVQIIDQSLHIEPIHLQAPCPTEKYTVSKNYLAFVFICLFLLYLAFIVIVQQCISYPQVQSEQLC